MINTPTPLAKVYRGSAVEAVHYGSIAVVNAQGELTHYAGEPEMVISMRSSVKPFQALPLLMSGGFDHFGFSVKQLAIMCASHNGTDEHRELVISNLKAAGNKPEDLQCGSHWPMGLRLDGIYPTKEEENDPLRHNCSGKHSGFLALTKFLNEDTKEYLNPESKMQKLIKQAVADMCEYPVNKIGTAIDGCSAPVFSFPLINLARGFKNLATVQAESPEMKKAINRVFEAMTSYPKMVAGEKRFDYDLMRSLPDNAVCKVGAEAVEGIGFAKQKIGIAVKIGDGNTRALWPVCMEVLRQLDIVDSLDKFPFLQTYNRPEVKNYTKKVTGKIEPVFELRKV
ncbi:MAG: asparaginase [candidate division Zixibacteria bacterium]|nr:asparaginase [candidate division Zixibacteria bacterium]